VLRFVMFERFFSTSNSPSTECAYQRRGSLR
jgi:hypothetical protein